MHLLLLVQKAYAGDKHSTVELPNSLLYSE